MTFTTGFPGPAITVIDTSTLLMQANATLYCRCCCCRGSMVTLFFHSLFSRLLVLGRTFFSTTTTANLTIAIHSAKPHTYAGTRHNHNNHRSRFGRSLARHLHRQRGTVGGGGSCLTCHKSPHFGFAMAGSQKVGQIIPNTRSQRTQNHVGMCVSMGCLGECPCRHPCHFQQLPSQQLRAVPSVV